MFRSCPSPFGGSRGRPAIAGLAGFTAVLAGLAVVSSATPAAGVAPDHLVISEVYGGGGSGAVGTTYTRDFVEIFNPTGSGISLNSMSVQYRSSANHSVASASATVSLAGSGTLAAGDKFVVVVGSPGAAGVAVPNADLVVGTNGGPSLSASAGQVWLASVTTPIDPDDAVASGLSTPTNANVVDFVGYGAAETREGGTTAPNAGNNSTSIQRAADGQDTNVNGTDFATVTPPNPGDGAAPAALAAVDPGDRTGTVGVPIAPITLTATGGTTPYSWDFSGLPAGVAETTDGVLNGTVAAPTDATVTAIVTDSASPAPATASTEFTITISPAPYAVTIAEIQGEGAATPIPNDIVTTQGVVTGSYPAGDGNLAGFFMQTGGPDTTPLASDGIFVFMGAKTSPAIGNSVQVTGKVSEFFDMTELTPATAADVTTVAALPPVVLGDHLPGTECTVGSCPSPDQLEVLRELHEGEAFLPTGGYTVTDSYDGTPFTQASSRGFQMQGEFGLAANSALPLMIPTETIDQSDSAALDAAKRYNDAHAVILDDGADIDYTANANNYEDTPFPWLTPNHSVRVGADVEFLKPVILEWRRDLWRVQPETKILGGTTGSDRVTFEQTRTNAPQDVLGDNGDLRIATFNMLNYFNTFGETWAASDGTATGSPGTTYNFANPRRCSYYLDRGPAGGGTATNRLTNDECTADQVDPLTGLNVKGLGPRGAANQASFDRQEDKELEAINTIDADVMSLEEVENSIKLYDASIDGPNGVDRNRDDALTRLVQELNVHWAAGHPSYVGNRWAYVASPRPEALPTVAEQDAIRSAFIYNPSKVEPVGTSQVLVNSAPFRNAREPLAQAFKPLGSGRADAFIVIVNHFKSKGGPTAPATVNGDNVDVGDGAGFYNGDRKRQATALVDFAAQVSANTNIEPVFFTGDFNSYSSEDPVQVIEAAGYENLQPTNGETTYSFGGLAGSLDHVFANQAAQEMVVGEDIWDINAGESVYYEYSRFNSNATDLYAVTPFRSSDHNPEIVGIDVGENTPTRTSTPCRSWRPTTSTADWSTTRAVRRPVLPRWPARSSSCGRRTPARSSPLPVT